MASPVSSRLPRRERSIAGPVVLILVGVLFLLVTLGVLDRFSFGRVCTAATGPRC